MEKILKRNLWVKEHRNQLINTRGVIGGVIGGIAGTLVMDIVLMGVFSAIGFPTLICFSIVGKTVAQFFSLFGIELIGYIEVGIITHYTVGPIVGALFGTALANNEKLREGPIIKSIIFVVVYIEIFSQPVLALAPLFLKMTASTTLLWFGGSFIMHFIWGVTVGIIVYKGLRLGYSSKILV